MNLSICIFCASSTGNSVAIRSAAQQLGTDLASAGYRIVFGGGHRGLMGILADAALEAGGEVIGVIPKALEELELAHLGLSKLYVTGSMHERKQMMAELSDAFVALPGGFGTLEEFCEMVTWGQLGIHAKPCILLNVDGYFDSLIGMFDHGVESGFISSEDRGIVQVASGVEELMVMLATER